MWFPRNITIAKIFIMITKYYNFFVLIFMQLRGLDRICKIIRILLFSYNHILSILLIVSEKYNCISLRFTLGFKSQESRASHCACQIQTIMALRISVGF